MTDSFQTEIPKARINITLDVETNGARQKKELPLKLLVLGDFTQGKTQGPVALRERININKNNFDQVLNDLSPVLIIDDVELVFSQFKDFHPDHIVSQVPQLKKLLAMRNLLKDLKSNLIDNNLFRKELEKLAHNKEAVLNIQKALKNQAPLDQGDLA